MPNGDIVITHREYITDVLGSVAFASNTFTVNPGLPGVFPWLSAIAQRFESYRFERLEFLFESESATSATGTVLIAPDYDASDAAPTTKSQAMTYRSCVRSPPWSDCAFQAIGEDLSKRKSYYVRSGTLSSNQDIKLYDTANVYVCTQGQASTAIIGEVYVSYKIRLMTPQAGPISLGEALSANFSGTSNAAPFATGGGTLPASVVSTGTTTSVSTWTFTQPWEGFISVIVSGTGITGIAISGTATGSEVSEQANAGGTNDIAVYGVTCDIGQTVVLTISNTTITASRAMFGQADN